MATTPLVFRATDDLSAEDREKSVPAVPDGRGRDRSLHWAARYRCYVTGAVASGGWARSSSRMRPMMRSSTYCSDRSSVAGGG